MGSSTAATLYYYRRLEIRGRLKPILLGLGSILYSLYFTHVPIGGRMVNFDGAGLTVAEVALSVVALAVCIAFDHFFMKLVEGWRGDTRRRAQLL